MADEIRAVGAVVDEVGDSVTETFHDAINELMSGPPEESERLIKLALDRLERVEQPHELSVMLDYNFTLIIPFEVAVPAYEKLLILTSNAPNALRHFATRLELTSPDFDERAAELRALADATDRANGVEPPKYTIMTSDGPLEEDD